MSADIILVHVCETCCSFRRIVSVDGVDECRVYTPKDKQWPCFACVLWQSPDKDAYAQMPVEDDNGPPHGAA